MHSHLLQRLHAKLSSSEPDVILFFHQAIDFNRGRRDTMNSLPVNFYSHSLVTVH